MFIEPVLIVKCHGDDKRDTPGLCAAGRHEFKPTQSQHGRHYSPSRRLAPLEHSHISRRQSHEELFIQIKLCVCVCVCVYVCACVDIICVYAVAVVHACSMCMCRNCMHVCKHVYLVWE